MSAIGLLSGRFDAAAAVLLLAVGAYFVLVSGGPAAENRFRLPIMPIVCRCGSFRDLETIQAASGLPRFATKEGVVTIGEIGYDEPSDLEDKYYRRQLALAAASNRLSGSHVRINLDQLGTRNREKILLDACLNAGIPFVVDNTNRPRKTGVSTSRRPVRPAFAAWATTSRRASAMPWRAMLAAGARCWSRHSTVEHPMDCGFRTVYGYTESDEISILLHPDDATFGRKIRKLDSVLAGEASACFSRALDVHGAFDGRVCQLPAVDDVVDYFRWRSEDAFRNALNAHCYWMQRQAGVSKTVATAALSGMSVGQKNELLLQGGINFNDLPGWQKRGVGVLWEEFEKIGVNPKTGEKMPAMRRRLRRELDLPMKDDYSAWVLALIGSGRNPSPEQT